VYKKNTSNRIFFFLRSLTTGVGLTGLTPTGIVSKDDGVQEAVAGTFTERGLGQYCFNGTAEDFNGDVLGFVFLGAGAIAYDISIVTSPVGWTDITTPVNMSRISNIIHRT
jgi:hypothetical protein